MRPLLFAILMMAITFCSVAFGGNELGNGGDLVAQEFTAAGQKLVEQLRAKPDARIPDLERFAQAVNTVKVSTADHLTLHGAEVDAINYPDESRIDVNRSRWKEADPGKRASLVLHEYLGVTKLADDGNYEISGSYAEAFAGPEENATKKWETSVSTSYGQRFEYGKGSGSRSPGLHFFVGRVLGPRSTLGLKLDLQQYVKYYDDGDESRSSYREIALIYKLWLSNPANWRPYIQMGAGYGQEKWGSLSSYTYGANGYYRSSFGKTIYESDKWYGDPAFQLGGGVRYSMLKEVGLDISLHYHQLGWDPTKRWNPKFAVFQTGISVLF